MDSDGVTQTKNAGTIMQTFKAILAANLRRERNLRMFSLLLRWLEPDGPRGRGQYVEEPAHLVPVLDDRRIHGVDSPKHDWTRPLGRVSERATATFAKADDRTIRQLGYVPLEVA